MVAEEQNLGKEAVVLGSRQKTVAKLPEVLGVGRPVTVDVPGCKQVLGRT